MANNEQSSIWIVVINPPKEQENPLLILEGYLSKVLSLNISYFIASIIHSKDLQEDGTPKTPHLHAFIDLLGNKCTKSHILTEIAEKVGLNKEQISIDATNNNYLQVQYLTHKNNSDRYQYDFHDIRTTNYDLLENRYNKIYVEPKNLDDAEIFSYIQDDTYLQDFIQHVGLPSALRYRPIFDAVKREQEEQKRVTLMESERERELMNSLMHKNAELIKWQNAFNYLVRTAKQKLTKEAYELLGIEFYCKKHLD